MKKVLAIILASIFCLSFAGCTGNSNSAKTSDTTASAASEAKATTEIATTADVKTSENVFSNFQSKFYSDSNSHYIVYSKPYSYIKNLGDSKTEHKINLPEYKNVQCYYYENVLFLLAIKSDGNASVMVEVDGKFNQLFDIKMRKEGDSVQRLEFCNNRIFYTDGTNLYSCSMNGKDVKKLISSDNSAAPSFFALDFAAFSNKIYCAINKVSSSGKYSSDIYKLNIDGTGKTAIANGCDYYDEFNVYDGILYFYGKKDDKTSIYSYNNGKCEKLCSIEPGNHNFLVNDGKIYYCPADYESNTVGSNNEIWAYTLKNNSNSKICTVKQASDIDLSAIINGKIYFVMWINESEQLGLTDLNGAGFKQLG